MWLKRNQFFILVLREAWNNGFWGFFVRYVRVKITCVVPDMVSFICVLSRWLMLLSTSFVELFKTLLDLLSYSELPLGLKRRKKHFLSSLNTTCLTNWFASNWICVNWIWNQAHFNLKLFLLCLDLAVIILNNHIDHTVLIWLSYGKICMGQCIVCVQILYPAAFWGRIHEPQEPDKV